MSSLRSTEDGRRRLRLLAVGLVIAGAVAFVAGLVAGAGGGDADRRAARSFLAAWQRSDYPAMYALIPKSAQEATPLPAFAADYRAAAATATLRAIVPGLAAAPRGGSVVVRVVARTRLFGSVRRTMRLPVKEGRIVWSPQLVFPGLRPGERLSARLTAPPRATLLARDGSVLARGADRSSALGPVAAEVVGRLGPAPPDVQSARRNAGFPASSPAGLSGLERIFETRLAGTPGGQLLAGSRELASVAPHRAPAVRTSISPSLERAAIAGLGGRLGGAALIDPRNGQVLALAGLAFSALQPPGSTFKIVTVTAALEAHATTLKSVYPVRTAAVLDGRTLENANGESCGGTLVQSFAQSCNSVFAPLGVRVGARHLVATAERFGFNRDPAIAGVATSSIPPASTISGELDLGSSAIGQGRVQATALQMATVAAAIGDHGRRPRPTFLARAHGRFDRVTSPAIARRVDQLMRAVVTGGTGTAASIPGVTVAGKTGTAELGPSGGTDAWFVAYAPARRPRIAVGVLLVKAGAGGDAAAPVAREMLVAGLKR
ncbi:MAG: penicillin-binding protein [Solirubrobacteraceae bacterium]|nr:penicillin-binding protein [Solirubrobacteraceae bacterium]